MTTWRTATATAIAAGALLATAGPAQAQRLAVDDVAGDAFGDGPDITRVAFSNRDRAVVTRVTFTRDRPGTVIVLIRARHRSAVGIISEHRRSGPDETFCVALDNGEEPCRGVTSEWDRSAAELRLRLPSRSLEDGDYGAVRGWALTEGRRDAADSDYAPERNGDLAPTDWIPRG
jgi:hypothetical protein